MGEVMLGKIKELGKRLGFKEKTPERKSLKEEIKEVKEVDVELSLKCDWCSKPIVRPLVLRIKYEEQEEVHKFCSWLCLYFWIKAYKVK
ncbi:MAG TPA: hypothetical protein ENG66_05215 [Thermococcus sp.]|nr:hypothetical protein [Thermococcus sp.]